MSGRIGRFYDRFRDRFRRRLLWFCFFGVVLIVRRSRFVRLLDDCLLFGRQHHGHVATFQPSHGLDLAGRTNLLDHRIEDSRTELRVAISRPRNCSVTLTLWPSARKSCMWRTFVSKSPLPIFGRNFTSLIETCTVFLRDSLAFWLSSYRNFP